VGLLEVMMIRVRALSVVAMVSFLGACAGTLPKANTSLFPNGTYQFYEHATGITTDFSGRVEIAGDSMHVTESSPSCLENTMRSQGYRAQSFTCGDFSLLASRETGHWEFRYATKRTVEETVEVCIAYTTVNGRQTCKATQKEHRERVIPVNGVLRLTRIGPADAPRSGTP
jgi:hypothetical protein